jgi:hypothetical protein
VRQTRRGVKPLQGVRSVGMEFGRRAAFVKDASVAGWHWLVEITNQLGAIVLLLGVLGISVVSALQLPYWWLGAVILGAFFVVLFGEGAYRLARGLEARLYEAQQASAPDTFPDVVVKTGEPLVVGTGESELFAPERETLIGLNVRVTNRERDRRAILAFSAHVTVPEPRPTIRKLRRYDKKHESFLPDPVKLDPQDSEAGEVLFLWDHSLDFVFGSLLGTDEEEKVIEFVKENLRVNATDHLSSISVDLDVPGTWRARNGGRDGTNA